MLKPFAQKVIAIELIFLTREELNVDNNSAGHTVLYFPDVTVDQEC